AFGGRGIIGQRYSSSGAPQGPEFRVNTYTTYNKQHAAVAADGAGNFVVVWASAGQEGSSYNFGIFGQRYSSSGAPQGPEFQVNTYTTSSQGYPAVATDSTGNFTVVWHSYQEGAGNGFGIFGQRFSSGGVPQGPEFRVNTQAYNTQAFPAVAADSASNFVVVWQSNLQDGSNYGVFGQRFTSVIPPCGNGTPDPGEDCDEGT